MTCNLQTCKCTNTFLLSQDDKVNKLGVVNFARQRTCICHMYSYKGDPNCFNPSQNQLRNFIRPREAIIIAGCIFGVCNITN